MVLGAKGSDFAAPEPFARRRARFQEVSSSCHQPSSGQEQVAEHEQGEELGAVFGQPPVAGLHMVELALDHPEGMLDLRADHGDDTVDPFVDGVQRAALGGLAHDAPNLARPGEGGLPFGADVALVGPDRGLLAVQQVVPDLAVMRLRR